MIQESGSVLVYRFTRADTKDQTIHMYNSKPMQTKTEQWLFPCEPVHQDRTGHIRDLWSSIFFIHEPCQRPPCMTLIIGKLKGVHFQVCGVKLWKPIPLDVRKTDTINVFETALKKYFWAS